MNYDKYVGTLPYGLPKTPERAAYYKAESDAYNNFRDDIKAEFGYELPDNVEALVFTMAWSQGHASGYSEVGYHYDDLADLARVAYQAGKNA